MLFTATQMHQITWKVQIVSMNYVHQIQMN